MAFQYFLESIIKTALAAGDVIMEIYATDFSVDLKSDNSPLTLADTRANELIVSDLKVTGIPVISEEGFNISYSKRQAWKYFWLVDPLDGTKEFVDRNGEFSVNIALIENRQPVMGVIYAPTHNLLYFSDPEGAWRLENAKETVSADSRVKQLKKMADKLPLVRHDQDFTIVISRSHLNPETTDYINKVKQHHDSIRLVSHGSSLKLCMIAEGQADVYPRFGITSEWDTAAGHAIIRAAGGKLVQMQYPDKPLTYNNHDLENPPFLAFPPKLSP